jgi:hypothetical protein
MAVAHRHHFVFLGHRTEIGRRLGTVDAPDDDQNDGQCSETAEVHGKISEVDCWKPEVGPVVEIVLPESFRANDLRLQIRKRQHGGVQTAVRKPKAAAIADQNAPGRHQPQLFGRLSREAFGSFTIAPFRFKRAPSLRSHRPF